MLGSRRLLAPLQAVPEPFLLLLRFDLLFLGLAQLEDLLDLTPPLRWGEMRLECVGRGGGRGQGEGIA